MKKTLLLGMFLCGTTMTFAQQYNECFNNKVVVRNNASIPSAIKRDSVVIDGVLTTTYDYKYLEDGGYEECENNYDDSGTISGKTISLFDSLGRHISLMGYRVESGVSIPFLGMTFVYGPKGNICAHNTYLPDTRINEFYLSSEAEYHIDEETNDSVFFQKDYDVEGTLIIKSEDRFDVLGNKISQTMIRVIDGKDCPEYKFEWKYSDKGYDLEEISYNWQDGKWTEVDKNIMEYYDNGKRKSWKHYLLQSGEYALVSYILYDEEGNPIEEFADSKNVVINNEYGADGRLKEKSEYEVVDDVKKPVLRTSYTYFTIEGENYFYRANNSSFDDESKSWKETGIQYFVPLDDDYVDMSVSHVNGYDSCFAYEIKENDIEKSWGIYTIINDELKCIEFIKYTYNECGDIVCEERFKNPQYKEGGSLELVKTIRYQYDKNTQSPIGMTKETHFILLDCVTTDAEGKEVSRTTYYYSEYKPTTSGITSIATSSDKAQSIYTISGQKVSATQAGQMYIQNGKKFIAK